MKEFWFRVAAMKNDTMEFEMCEEETIPSKAGAAFAVELRRVADMLDSLVEKAEAESVQ